jgi:hypothetical protein
LCVTSEVLMSLSRCKGFWDMSRHSGGTSCFHLQGVYHIKLLWNVGTCLPSHGMSYPRRQQSWFIFVLFYVTVMLWSDYAETCRFASHFKWQTCFSLSASYKQYLRRIGGLVCAKEQSVAKMQFPLFLCLTFWNLMHILILKLT